MFVTSTANMPHQYGRYFINKLFLILIVCRSEFIPTTATLTTTKAKEKAQDAGQAMDPAESTEVA